VSKEQLYKLENEVEMLMDFFEENKVPNALLDVYEGNIRKALKRVDPALFGDYALTGGDFPSILSEALFVSANHDPYNAFNSIVWSDTVTVVSSWVDKLNKEKDMIVSRGDEVRNELWSDPVSRAVSSRKTASPKPYRGTYVSEYDTIRDMYRRALEDQEDAVRGSTDEYYEMSDDEWDYVWDSMISSVEDTFTMDIGKYADEIVEDFIGVRPGDLAGTSSSIDIDMTLDEWNKQFEKESSRKIAYSSWLNEQQEILRVNDYRAEDSERKSWLKDSGTVRDGVKVVYINLDEESENIYWRVESFAPGWDSDEVTLEAEGVERSLKDVWPQTDRITHPEFFGKESSSIDYWGSI